MIEPGRTTRETTRYEVILSGPALPGFTPDQVLAALSVLFDTPAHELNKIFIGGEHPIDHLFSADEALAMQERLEGIGLRASVVRASRTPPQLALRQPPQDAGNTIARTGAGGPASAASRQDSTPSSHGAGQDARAQSAKAPRHPTEADAQQHWQNGWHNPDEEDTFEGPDQVALFVGPANDHYRAVFARFSPRGGSGIALSWNWAAFISPFLWAMYRKMWSWGLVIGITEVILPMTALFMGLQGFVSHKLIYVGLLGIVANRLFWPALVNYLYYRHVNESLRRLHHMVTYVADVDIASRGGTSKTGVLVGLAFSAVSILFLWSLLDSVRPPPDAYQPSSQGTPAGAKRNDVKTGLPALAVTQSRLQQLGAALGSWAGEHGNGVISLRTLSLEKGLSGDLLADGWGVGIRLLRESGGYRLVSAGPDRRFDTSDDVELFVRARSVANPQGPTAPDAVAPTTD